MIQKSESSRRNGQNKVLSNISLLVNKKHEINRQIYHEIIEAGQHEDFVIKNKEWGSRNWKHTFSTIKDFNFRKGLCLNDNHAYSIVMAIRDVRFPHLTQLVLNGNNIMTIESLSRIFLPSLEKLWIGNNMICSIECLKKCHFPKLSRLLVHDNLLINLFPLSLLQGPSFMGLTLEFPTTKERCEDIRIIVKMETRVMEEIDLSGKERIKQRKALRAIERKFPHQGQRKRIKIYEDYQLYL